MLYSAVSHLCYTACPYFYALVSSPLTRVFVQTPSRKLMFSAAPPNLSHPATPASLQLLPSLSTMLTPTLGIPILPPLPNPLSACLHPRFSLTPQCCAACIPGVYPFGIHTYPPHRIHVTFQCSQKVVFAVRAASDFPILHPCHVNDKLLFVFSSWAWKREHTMVFAVFGAGYHYVGISCATCNLRGWGYDMEERTINWEFDDATWRHVNQNRSLIFEASVLYYSFGRLRRGGEQDARLLSKSRSKKEMTYLTSHLDAESLIRGTQFKKDPIKSNSFEPLIMRTCLIEDSSVLVLCFDCSINQERKRWNSPPTS